MIPQRDLLRFEKALIDLYAPGLTSDTYGNRSLKLLASLFESDLSALIVRDTVRENIQMVFNRLPPDLEKNGEIFAKLAPKYPWFRADPSIHEGRPHSRSDFCSDRQFRNLDIHSEVFRNWGFHHFLSMYVHSEKSRVVFFGFNRVKGDFSSRERELVSLARPHLSSARHLAHALEERRSHAVSPEIFSRCGFTSRESEVLYWLTEGKSNAEIAMILGISLPTTKGYITTIFNKTGAGNRLAVVLYALGLAKKAMQTAPSPRPGAALRMSYPLPK